MDMNDDIDDLGKLRSSLEAQVIELLRLRAQLIADMRETIRYTSRAMASVERGDVLTPPEAVPPMRFEEAPPPAGEARPALQLEVGMLSGFPAVSALEAELRQLAGVTEVYVKRYDGSTAEIEVGLAGSGHGPLMDWLGERFQVEAVAEDRFVLSGIRTNGQAR